MPHRNKLIFRARHPRPEVIILTKASDLRASDSSDKPFILTCRIKTHSSTMEMSTFQILLMANVLKTWLMQSKLHCSSPVSSDRVQKKPSERESRCTACSGFCREHRDYIDGRGQEVDIHYTWIVHRTAFMWPGTMAIYTETIRQLDGKMFHIPFSVSVFLKVAHTVLKPCWRKIILTTDYLCNVYTISSIQHGAVTVESWANRKRGRAATSRGVFTSSATECGCIIIPLKWSHTTFYLNHVI